MEMEQLKNTDDDREVDLCKYRINVGQGIMRVLMGNGFWEILIRMWVEAILIALENVRSVLRFAIIAATRLVQFVCVNVSNWVCYSTTSLIIMLRW